MAWFPDKEILHLLRKLFFCTTMKRRFLVLSLLCVVTSCSPLLYSGLLPIGDKVQTVARDLTPSEDPATGLYGYLNNLGIWVIAPQFKSAKSFSDGMARVKKGSYYGAIDPLCQWVVQPVFSSSLDCDEAIRSICKGRLAGVELWAAEDPATELYGFLNHFGIWHIKPQYESGYNFDSDGYAVVKLVNGGWGAINRSNQWVIQPNFTSKLDLESALSKLKR